MLEIIHNGLDTLSSLPFFYYPFTFIISLLVGSFLNVVILRTPKILEREFRSECCELLEISDDKGTTESISLSYPPSTCPKCDTKIKAWHNIPLIAKRPNSSHQGGLWEFPGGKVEEGETVFDALVREFREEVGIEIQSAEPLQTIEHHYFDKHVLLDVWRCIQFNGIARGIEGQEIKWVALEDINNHQFPDANKQIIENLVT